MDGAGKVILVGAGPGDPDLLTLKAAKAIQQADVILLDDLVNPELLRHARADARVIAVGKRGGCQSTPQAFIEKLMLAEARAGRCVVRLKGGDPFVFGRGGEERAYLLAAGIRVEVVNGISSGLAAASALGIPLTHRDYAQGVMFVTGHGKDGASQPDWAALAKTGLTLVVYMGVAHCTAIQQALLAGGMRADTPVAVVQSATCATQRQLLTELGQLSAALAASGLGSPSVLVIGAVVHCADLAQPSPALRMA
ncbi:MAG: uroporphyrinogen-III C-methyltransferase [Burkholderiales bacterium]|nr:uroporphyrinogen-III C-methyltransferase [Burkholderiales bacterium]